MLRPAPDISGPLVAVAVGLNFGLIVFPLIILSETIVLWLLKWGPFSRSLFDAVIANVASTIAGGAFLFLVAGIQFWLGLPNSQPSAFIEIFGWLFLVPWLLSVVIEGGVLWLLQRHPARKTWKAALAMNTASYIQLGILYLILVVGPTILRRAGL